MVSKSDEPPDVTIVAAGYATDQLWLDAIRMALKYHRKGIAIDRDGLRSSLEAALHAAESDW